MVPEWRWKPHIVRAAFRSYVIGDGASVASAEAHVIASDGRALERMPLVARGKRA
jgi:hypothetical protein